jgi:hypothetical protein
MKSTDHRIAEVLESMRRAPLIRDYSDEGLRQALLGLPETLELRRVPVLGRCPSNDNEAST